jgi:hypothetical protein
MICWDILANREKLYQERLKLLRRMANDPRTIREAE